MFPLMCCLSYLSYRTFDCCGCAGERKGKGLGTSVDVSNHPTISIPLQVWVRVVFHCVVWLANGVRVFALPFALFCFLICFLPVVPVPFGRRLQLQPGTGCGSQVGGAANPFPFHRVPAASLQIFFGCRACNLGGSSWAC